MSKQSDERLAAAVFGKLKKPKPSTGLAELDEATRRREAAEARADAAELERIGRDLDDLRARAGIGINVEDPDQRRTDEQLAKKRELDEAREERKIAVEREAKRAEANEALRRHLESGGRTSAERDVEEAFNALARAVRDSRLVPRRELVWGSPSALIYERLARTIEEAVQLEAASIRATLAESRKKAREARDRKLRDLQQ